DTSRDSPSEAQPRSSTAAPEGDDAELFAVRAALDDLHREMLAVETRALADRDRTIHPRFAASSRNLAPYVALRQHDVREPQARPARPGLRPLGPPGPPALAAVAAVRRTVRGLLGLEGEAPPPPPVAIGDGRPLLERHARDLLGEKPTGRDVRVMVTLPSEA